jgi:arylsulfatase A-like enzyme
MSHTNRRDFLRTFPPAAAAFTANRRIARAASSRPNVIILLTDDQGYGDLSCHGNPVIKTPNMDRLHGESVRFTDFHAAPMCTPCRGQLMSGMDALHNRATSVTAGRACLRRDIPTMADVFAAGGYRTGLFGKWHLGDHYPYRPMDRGFREAKYFLGYGMSSAPEFDNDYFDGRYRDNGVPKQFQGYCTDFWFGQAMDWMRAQHQQNQPFFCYLPTNAPHGPTWVGDEWSAPYRKPGVPSEFFGMIANVDWNMGKLDKFLAESGLRDNTVLVFMTDNGGTGGVRLYNAGMRGNKTTYYEGGHRVPCFVRWPAGGLRTPRDVEDPSGMQDLLPTMIDLCSLQKPPQARFDGTSLAGLLKGSQKTLADRMIVVQYGQVPEKWDSCVMWNKWRLVKGKELYDLKTDPGQKTDVAAAHADVVAKMREHYEKWWAPIEPTLRDFLPISLGSDKENPVTLVSSDWEDIYADNPNTVLSAGGGPRGGPWSVLVERDGDYEISLYRWPPQLKLALNAACPPQKRTKGSLPEGKAMPVAGAKLAVAGQELAKTTDAADTAAVFRVKLKGATRTTLQGWFQDAKGADLCGSFYANVKRL